MATKKRIFDENCAIIPEVVADSVVSEASNLFFSVTPKRTWSPSARAAMIAHLTDHAEATCQANATFKKSILGTRGNAGRDRLYMWMRHWLASYLAKKHPDIRSALGFVGFANGQY